MAETRVLPEGANPSLVARLRWQRRAAPSAFELRLFIQVTRRRTHRGGFEPLALMPGLLAALRHGAERDGAALRVAADEGTMAALAAVVDIAERVQRSDSGHVREFAAWAPPPGSLRLDGVSPSSYPARPDRTSPDFPGRGFARGHGWGLPASSPAAATRFTGVACLLTTPEDAPADEDTPADWVHAGWLREKIRVQLATGATRSWCSGWEPSERDQRATPAGKRSGNEAMTSADRPQPGQVQRGCLRHQSQHPSGLYGMTLAIACG